MIHFEVPLVVFNFERFLSRKRLQMSFKTQAHLGWFSEEIYCFL